MIIRTMDASFGGLENAHMELEPGLNIIEAPNEAGKSTWCGFIRTMLYGINTSQREKNGILPDKKRFLPWGSYPMAGSMRIEWRGGDVTLSRKGSAGKPMGNCEAKLSGTAEKVPELCGKAPGEVILGVPESVFRRSAFISGGALAVDKDSELEKRISALITSGSEEDESYSAAHDKLHGWRVKRKHNARVGRAAEIGGRIWEKEAALEKIREETARLGDIYAEREKQSELAAMFERELKLHDAAKARAEYAKAADARQTRERAAAALESAQREADGLSAEKIAVAREAVSRYKEAAAAVKAGSETVNRYNDALAEREKAEHRMLEMKKAASGISREGIADSRRALYEYENARTAAEKALSEWNSYKKQQGAAAPAQKASPLLAVLGVILVILGAAGCFLHAAAAAIAVIGIVLLIMYFSGRQKAKNKAAAVAEAQRAELAVYENMEREAQARLHEAEHVLTAALAAIGGETIPERAAGRIDERERLLAELEQAEREAEAAERVESSLAPARAEVYAAAEAEDKAASVLYDALEALGIEPASADVSAAIEARAELLEAFRRAEAEYTAAVKLEESIGELPDVPDEGEEAAEPKISRDEAELGFNMAEAQLNEMNRRLTLSEGELHHLGDPLILATEAENLRAELAEVEEEYEALSLAMSVLEEANAELQQRFAPIVGSVAGKLMSAMTGGAYDRVSFDREFNFTASRANEPEHGVEYLSTGTSGQLYLAVRLAICLLALPEEEPCPIILDDALLGFDDKRAKAALELLKELAQERQIILFTCQSREKMLINA